MDPEGVKFFGPQRTRRRHKDHKENLRSSLRERFQSPPFREDLGGLNTDGHEDGEVALIRGWTRRRRRDANRVLFSKSSLQGGFRRA